MKTNDLTEAALDWAVAKCETDDTLDIYFDEVTGEPLEHDDWQDNQTYSPSTNWAQGGAIIERESINLWRENAHARWCASADEYKPDYWATSPLVAAMRCYVASQLGDEIEIPEELKND